MREELKAILERAWDGDADHCLNCGEVHDLGKGYDDCIVDSILKLFTDKVRGIENPTEGTFEFPDKKDKGAGHFYGFEMFRTALLKEVEQ